MKGMSETVSTASNAADAWTNPLRDPRDLRLPRIAGPCSIVIFGVTGDLSRKKLLPAIYDLANRGLLPPSFGLTGFARRDWTEDHFKDFVKENVQAHCRTPFKESTWKQLASGIRFVQGTFDDPKAFERLSDTVAELDRDRGTRGNHAFYMSVPPRAFPQVSRQLADCGLAKSSEGAWRRVIIEKPFGHDLASAKELDRVVSEVFDPSSVFRIDHYLGKETVQNILALRFANAMYEPIWNNNYVDHVQITMAEDIGVAGRAGYYDGIGAARDIIQNHLLQLMALTAMEEPVSFSAADLTAEKTKVLSAVRLPKDLAAHTARGQYAAGWQGSHEVVGYLGREGHRSRIHHRDLCRDPPGRRHPPLGRRAVLSAYRQAPGQARHGDRRGVQTRPASAVRIDRHQGARQERRRDPRAARRGRDHALRREGAGRHVDGGARRVDGLRLRSLVHRILP